MTFRVDVMTSLRRFWRVKSRDFDVFANFSHFGTIFWFIQPLGHATNKKSFVFSNVEFHNKFNDISCFLFVA